LALDTVGGVETLFAAYMATAADERLEHHVLVTRERVHPQFRADVLRGAASVHMAKYLGPFKLPRWPRRLRLWRLGQVARRVRPDVVLLRNCLGDLQRSRIAGCISPPAANVYYEHGSAWGEHPLRAVSAFLDQMDGLICNSHASRRMLELRWNCRAGLAHVCHNGLRLPPPPEGSIPRRLPSSGPVRLGFAGRLVAYKGVVLAVHALKELSGSGRLFELHVAGGGPELDGLRALAGRLGLGGAVCFHGVVADMPAFCSSIDVLLCPSLREPLGNVCMEAAFYGCPVVATAVDGIPEIVADGQTGFCVPPVLDGQAYADLGGSGEKLPEWVYDPTTDTLAPARSPDPRQLAQAVLRVCADGERYQQMSARAHERARSRFDMTTYVQALNGLLLQFAGRGA
jgi:glycosyltransferase involved in cell wall biosynthesis